MTDDQRLGTLLRDGERVGLRYERDLRHPPEKVWRALTESDQLRHWFPTDLDGERRAGADVALTFWPALATRHGITETVTRGRILTWQPTTVFELDWEGDLIRWDLSPTAEGTRLVLTTWLGPQSLETGTHRTAAGYHVCLVALAELLDTGTSTPLAEVDPTPWEQTYEAALPG